MGDTDNAIKWNLYSAIHVYAKYQKSRGKIIRFIDFEICSKKCH